MAKGGVAVGTVEEKVTRTRTLSPQEALSSPEPAEFWDVVDELHAAPLRWETEDWKIYLYRLEPTISRQTNEPSFADKCYGLMDMPDGRQAPFSIEAVREKFGGHVFRAILKRGGQRIAETKIVIEAAPKFAQPTNTSGGMPLPVGSQQPTNADTTATVATRAMDIVSQQEANGINIGINALRAASDIISARTAAPPSDPLRDKLLDILLQRALEPPKIPDPIETFKIMKDIFSPAPSNGLQDTIKFIGDLKNSGLFAIGGRGGAGMMEVAGQVLPSVANAAVEGMREWRLGIEAQERVMAMQRGGPVPVQQNPRPVEGLHAAPPTEAPFDTQGRPAPVADAGPPTAQEASLEWNLSKVVEIMKDLSLTVDEQVDEILAFLYRSKPEMVAQILDPPKIHAALPAGPEGLLKLFQMHPVLMTVPVNPRLTEFIKKFWAAAVEEERKRVEFLGKQPPPPKSA